MSIFYAFNLAYAFYQGSRWRVCDAITGFDGVWPVRWLEALPNLDLSLVARTLLLANLAAAFVACLWPNMRSARIAASLCLFFQTAYINSFGAIGHNVHFLIWTGFIFIFLPDLRKADERIAYRQRYLFVFWAAQFACLFFYSMSGGMKLVGAAYQFSIGEITAFHPSAMARHIASVQLTIDGETFLGDFIIRNLGNVAWPLFVGALFLEVFSVGIAFRPNLHRIWGGALLAMHAGIGLTMDIWFTTHFFVIGLLLVNSPFHEATRHTESIDTKSTEKSQGIAHEKKLDLAKARSSRCLLEQG